MFKFIRAWLRRRAYRKARAAAREARAYRMTPYLRALTDQFGLLHKRVLMLEDKAWKDKT